jgi:hypothetical protein
MLLVGSIQPAAFLCFKLGANPAIPAGNLVVYAFDIEIHAEDLLIRLKQLVWQVWVFHQPARSC